MALEIIEGLAWTKALSEADTRANLIDPALHSRGWTRDLIELEESAEAGASSIVKYRTN